MLGLHLILEVNITFSNNIYFVDIIWSQTFYLDVKNFEMNKQELLASQNASTMEGETNSVSQTY